jgi:hypothetical protein
MGASFFKELGLVWILSVHSSEILHRKTGLEKNPKQMLVSGPDSGLPKAEALTLKQTLLPELEIRHNLKRAESKTCKNQWTLSICSQKYLAMSRNDVSIKIHLLT